MSKTLSLAGVILFASGYVSYKNFSAVAESSSDVKSEQLALDKASSDYKSLEAKIKKAAENEKNIQAKTQEMGGEAEKIQSDILSINSEIETKKNKIQKSKQDLDQIREKSKELGDISELANNLKLIGQKSEDLRQSLRGQEAQLSSIAQTKAALVESSKQLNDEIQKASTGQSAPDFKSRISSVYGDWGFVTIAAGSDSGIVANSKLKVFRGGEQVGNLIVSAVEKNSSSASIVNMESGQNSDIQVGDIIKP